MNAKLFEGNYRILSTLGKGGMGTVYLAENIRLGTLWAIKEITRKPGSKTDMFVEPNILKKLNHPALPRIFDILEDEESIYLIVDYIDGENLEEILKREGKFPEAKVIDWAKQLCDVLNYLHTFKPNPIIYRDIKPSNIMLTKDEKIKLIDFGIAREYKEDAGSDTVYIGTRGYAAPEQYGLGQTSVASDIYSLGITMFHLLTGISPMDPSFELKPVRYFDKDLSVGIERIISKCTMYNPSERYSKAMELHTALEQLESSQRSSFLGNSEMRLGDAATLSTAPEGRIISFKKLIITVFDNAEFACELAYTAARCTNLNVLLLDLDTLNATADEYLNVPKYPKNIRSFEEPLDNTGLNICMDAADKKILTRELFLESLIQKLKNFYILTGNYNLSNFEYYSEASLNTLIEKAYELFDITIIITNGFIYDAFTLIALRKSDYNIAAVKADKITVRKINRYLVYLKEKQNIPPEKTKFVAYEYNGRTDLRKDIMNELTEGNYIGWVSCSQKRQVYRNMRPTYAKNMDKKIRNEYIHILSRFNIVPRRTLLGTIRDSLTLGMRKLRKAFAMRRKAENA
ncbi:serine/threonine protein kinase [Clostridium thermosuccinogenes]|uniref:serine/threonine protein kinase n=1 Tax=Clostridium thermosuccinogenes TaxID=84032 RepID=UPI000CCC74C4|nr:serine/threonine-protein kinase [Pseudoclostridium thermosuccinogenes]PNT91468.1 hypothetical protein CDQ83_16925 [Pseudoclostridium thermosuccinogenes]